MSSSASRLIRIVGVASILVVGLCTSPPLAGAAQTILPSADGTLTDGGVYGVFDGLADHWDWTYNQSSYEGAITRSVTADSPSIEQRVIWEYNLSAVTLPAPVRATLYFTLRGAALYPMPDAVIQVYAYPSDLAETSTDFSAGPALLQGSITVPGFTGSALYSLDVSAPVNSALTSGVRKTAFRFQASTGASIAQAFIDAMDADVTTKPYLSIDAGSAGVPAAVVSFAVSRGTNAGAPGGICDLILLPPRRSEPRTSGIREVRIGFDVAPGTPAGSGATLESSTCAVPSFLPYGGASAVASEVVGNLLVLSFSPALENARTYRITLDSSVTTVAGQVIEVRGLVGDVDGNGRVNSGDRSVIVGVWTSPTPFSCVTDVNGSGATNASDRSVIVGAWTGNTNCAP